MKRDRAKRVKRGKLKWSEEPAAAAATTAVVVVFVAASWVGQDNNDATSTAGDVTCVTDNAPDLIYIYTHVDTYVCNGTYAYILHPPKNGVRQALRAEE